MGYLDSSYEKYGTPHPDFFMVLTLQRPAH